MTAYGGVRYSGESMTQAVVRSLGEWELVDDVEECVLAAEVATDDDPKRPRAVYLALVECYRKDGTPVASGAVAPIYYSREGGGGSDAEEKFVFRLVGEDEGPVRTDCPVSILDRLGTIKELPSTMGKHDARLAREWRKACWKHAKSVHFPTRKV